jgi:hypothetical protein
MRKTSSDTSEPWCAPTREVDQSHMLELARKAKRTGKHALSAPVNPAPRYQLATLEDRELADGSTPDLVDPFMTPSRVSTVVVPSPVQRTAGGTRWALALAILLMLATAGGIAAIVLFL